MISLYHHEFTSSVTMRGECTYQEGPTIQKAIYNAVVFVASLSGLANLLSYLHSKKAALKSYIAILSPGRISQQNTENITLIYSSPSAGGKRKKCTYMCGLHKMLQTVVKIKTSAKNITHHSMIDVAKLSLNG